MVSVIIPTFNARKYIEESIKSVLTQSYKDYEIIVIDDGSSDDTYKVLEKYKDKIRYYYTRNRGVAAARNFGILESKGGYICFLDADDLYKSDKLKKQIEFLEENTEIDIVYNDMEVVDEDLNYISTLKSEGVYSKKEDFLCMLLVRQIIPGPASIMLRRKCIEIGVLYNERYRHAEDYDFTIRLARMFTYGYLPQDVYIYRRHTSNLTNQHELQLNNEIKIIRELGNTAIKDIVLQSSFKEEEKKLIYAKILIKIGEWEQAKKALLDISEAKSNELTYFYLGNCCYHLLEYKQAEKYYMRSLLINSNLAEAYNNLGCVNVKLNEFSKARINYYDAIQIKDGYMDAAINLDNLKKGSSLCKITEKELRRTLTKYT